MQPKRTITHSLTAIASLIGSAVIGHVGRSGLVLRAAEEQDPTSRIEVVSDGEEQAEAGSAADGGNGEGGAQGSGASLDDPDDENDDPVVSFGDEPAEGEGDGTSVEGEDGNHVIRGLRQQHKEQTRAIRAKEREVLELRQQLQVLQGGAAQVQVGPKPTLESCNYDDAKFEAELEAWSERKALVKAQEQNAQKAVEDQRAAYGSRQQAYVQQRQKLTFSDVDDAEDTVKSALNDAQQAIIISGAENAAQIVYALGKSPKKLAELAAVKDPIQFAFKVAKLESQVKLTPRKTAPAPDRSVKSTVSGASAVGGELDRLEKEAEQSGDRSKLLAYKRQQRAKQTA